MKPANDKQALFLDSKSDITIFTGAGIGKSYCNLILHKEGVQNQNYYGLYARSTPRALNFIWDEAIEEYQKLGWDVKVANKDKILRFPCWNSSIEFRYGSTFEEVSRYSCSRQYSRITVDEFTQLEFSAFKYLLSRVRSYCKIHDQLYLTGNPTDNQEWVDFVRAWTDEHGFPIEERNGKEFKLCSPWFGGYCRSVKLIHDKCDNNPYLPEDYYKHFFKLSENALDLLYRGRWGIKL